MFNISVFSFAFVLYMIALASSTNAQARVPEAPEVSIKGVLVDREGKPIAGMSIFLRNVGKQRGDSSLTSPLGRKTYTDQQGQFKVEAGPGIYCLFAQGAKLLVSTRRVPAQITVKSTDKNIDLGKLLLEYSPQSIAAELKFILDDPARKVLMVKDPDGSIWAFFHGCVKELKETDIILASGCAVVIAKQVQGDPWDVVSILVNRPSDPYFMTENEKGLKIIGQSGSLNEETTVRVDAIFSIVNCGEYRFGLCR